MNLQYYTPTNKNEVFFTSDIHGFHKNITRGVSTWDDKTRCRDFDDEVKMTKYIVNKINDKVPANATLFHLGDWSFSGQANIAILRGMINCQNVVHILGNHDHNIIKNESYHSLFDWIGYYNEFRIGKRLICMSHYPMEIWNEIGRNSIMTHGHCHHTLKTIRSNRIDVGVDGPWDYTPLHINEMLEFLPNVNEKFLDHHTSRTNYG